MNVKGNALPKIMYDQSQFTPLWLVGSDGAYLNEEAYRLMRDLSGYAPSIWYTYTQNKPTSFWFGAFDLEALAKEAENGYLYFSKLETFPYFEEKISEFLNEATSLSKKFIRDIYGKEEALYGSNPGALSAFLKDCHELEARLMGHYLLTQPQRFTLFEERLKDHLMEPAVALVATSGHRLTLVSSLQKTIVEYAAGDTSLEEMNARVDALGFLTWSALGGELTTKDSAFAQATRLKSNREELMQETEKVNELQATLKKRMGILSHASGELLHLADLAGQAPVLRFDLQTIALCLWKYMDLVVGSAQKKYGLTKDAISSYTFAEIISLIDTGVLVEESELEKRRQGCLIEYTDSGVRTFYASEAHAAIKELLDFRKREMEEAREVKGTTASFPDKKVANLRGECFVMTTAFGGSEAIKAFKEGQILVATQTHPNLVPAMKQALAIVTDEGGITCHAAIVSRELGKPCIIGTRLATKVFKTGDMIEMDMTTGIVKKL